jgi:hypothetical protein
MTRGFHAMAWVYMQQQNLSKTKISWCRKIPLALGIVTLNKSVGCCLMQRGKGKRNCVLDNLLLLVDIPLFLEFFWERTLLSQMEKDEAGRLKMLGH